MMKPHARVMNLAVLAACSLLLGALLLPGMTAYADSDRDGVCGSLPRHGELQAALATARQAGNGGFNLDMWGTAVNRDGIVCAVAFTGADRGSEWPGSRVISAQKANTANSFSLPGLALSTADLYAAVQPGGSLFGLQESNPVDTEVAYGGEAADFGQSDDPMVGNRLGGVNVFGWGLALYARIGGKKVLVGAIGVSGDSSCADHNIAWLTRHNLGLDYVPAGVSPDRLRPDNIVYDIGYASSAESSGASTSGWGHPACNGVVAGIAANLPAVKP